jgi:hypothetical protein
MTALEPREIDAYRYPRRVTEGCMHRLGCKCDPPFWLRAMSPAEEARIPKVVEETHE